MNNIGIVIIGRNEGKRLQDALTSIKGKVTAVIYVDSGSSDNSVEVAKDLDLEVLKLNSNKPFTAARARNEGADKLIEAHPGIKYIQFIDGDCELVDSWLGKGIEALEINPEAAVVCGRRRERFPNVSIYNRLCDMEWNTSIGDVKACGGDSMMRIKAFQEAGGFNANLIAGEEPELCSRLHQKGWRIMRINSEMTLHDANMTRFSEWQKRTMRAGYAYMGGFYLHDLKGQRHNAKDIYSIVFWGGILPFLIVLFVWGNFFVVSLLFLLYLYLYFKIFFKRKRQFGDSILDSNLYSFFVILGKFFQFAGILKFLKDKIVGQKSTLIEYRKK